MKLKMLIPAKLNNMAWQPDRMVWLSVRPPGKHKFSWPWLSDGYTAKLFPKKTEKVKFNRKYAYTRNTSSFKNANVQILFSLSLSLLLIRTLNVYSIRWIAYELKLSTHIIFGLTCHPFSIYVFWMCYAYACLVVCVCARVWVNMFILWEKNALEFLLRCFFCSRSPQQICCLVRFIGAQQIASSSKQSIRIRFDSIQPNLLKPTRYRSLARSFVCSPYPYFYLDFVLFFEKTPSAYGRE